MADDDIDLLNIVVARSHGTQHIDNGNNAAMSVKGITMKTAESQNEPVLYTSDNEGKAESKGHREGDGSEDFDLLAIVKDRILSIQTKENGEVEAPEQHKKGGFKEKQLEAGVHDISESISERSVNECGGELVEDGITLGVTPPPRLRRRNDVEHMGSLPGSYHVGGNNAIDDPLADDTDYGELFQNSRRDPDYRLAVAIPVDDPSTLDLPQANDLHAINESVRDGQRQTKQFKTYMLLAVLALVAAAMIVFVVLVPSPNTTVETPNHSPSSDPTNSYELQILSLFPEDTINAIVSETDRFSPQSRAFSWLLQDLHDQSHYPADERIRQRFALATLYFSTNGDEWKNNTNWLSHSVHECDWFNKHVFASKDFLSQSYPGFLEDFFPPTGPHPKTCDENGLYQNLWLDKNKLVGPLPEELYLLTTLKTLSLGLNTLEGTISTSIGQLTSLEGLGMIAQPADATIPSEIGLLSELKVLLFSQGKMPMPIPREVWQLSKMESLVLMYQQLQGSIPSEIGNFMPNLKWLILDACELSGTIPSELGLVQSLEWIVISRNRFSGMIPSELGQLSNILLLYMAENEFEGLLPTELGLLTSLEYLITVRDNRLSGPIPSELGLLTNLTTTLTFRNNQFSSTIPTQLGLLRNLLELDFRNNQLTGPLPTELGELTSIGHLTIAQNDLSGTIPQELANLYQSLHTLDFSGNMQLSGTVPEALCDLNGTCVGSSLDECQSPFGLSFNCSSMLCGCSCACL